MYATGRGTEEGSGFGRFEKELLRIDMCASCNARLRGIVSETWRFEEKLICTLGGVREKNADMHAILACARNGILAASIVMH
ncbi:MAG: hypothetical protein IMW93_08925 [Thermoanaerobacteraceae bacterium]|nr:hypothetical protein [Thermoanaerobacteraceae bacterium]